jgi:hypothetical protein
MTQNIAGGGSLSAAGLIAPCGMNCALCLAYQRAKIHCPGCRAEGAGKLSSCLVCSIKLCHLALVDNLEFCHQCAAYPCARIRHIDKRYRDKYAMSMVANLQTIQSSGVDVFAAQQRERWRCPGCGGLICVHRPKCLHCGLDWRSTARDTPPEVPGHGVASLSPERAAILP